MEETVFDFKQARRTFSRIGFALCAILVIATLLQTLWISVPTLIWGEDNWTTSSWGVWLGTFLPLYLVAIPVGLLILRKLPAAAPASQKLGGKNFLIFFTISCFLMYAGNLLGTWLSSVLSGGTAENAVLDYVADTHPLKIVFLVILAPLLEEYVCRKQIIDRTRQYGEKTAVLLSALVFGLLHQNLFQFFYAFALGLVFAYIYTRTGRLRYPVLLHSIVNFMGGVIAPAILSLVDMDALSGIDPAMPPEAAAEVFLQVLPGLLVLFAYALCLLALSVTGLIQLLTRYKTLTWEAAENPLPPGTASKTVYRNAGMVLYILLCAGFMILALVV